MRNLGFGSIRNPKGVIDLTAKAALRSLQLGLPKQELYGSQVFAPPVDQSSIGAAHRMGAVGSGMPGKTIPVGLSGYPALGASIHAASGSIKFWRRFEGGG